MRSDTSNITNERKPTYDKTIISRSPPKELQEKFKNTNVIISDLNINPETDAVPIEKNR